MKKSMMMRNESSAYDRAAYVGSSIAYGGMNLFLLAIMLFNIAVMIAGVLIVYEGITVYQAYKNGDTLSPGKMERLYVYAIILAVGIGLNLLAWLLHMAKKM